MLVSWITEENMRKIVRTEDALKFSFVLSSDDKSSYSFLWAYYYYHMRNWMLYNLALKKLDGK